jgi:hypothetical protein
MAPPVTRSILPRDIARFRSGLALLSSLVRSDEPPDGAWGLQVGSVAHLGSIFSGAPVPSKLIFIVPSSRQGSVTCTSRKDSEKRDRSLEKPRSSAPRR